ncbi:ATP-binding cassette domain-containing protein, partial [Bradyrhizobium sp.]|uniref:ATP-binding cassette domain-containing protein n=1 Tax=Bradyrhizobium sp. TaxID=376 RepID=UPI00391A40A7
MSSLLAEARKIESSHIAASFTRHRPFRRQYRTKIGANFRRQIFFNVFTIACVSNNTGTALADLWRDGEPCMLSSATTRVAETRTEARGCALALQGVGHSFGATVALESIYLAVARGELIALLGPSGCGKSSVLKLIAGLDTASAGTVISPATQAPGEAATAFVFQDP